MRRGPGISGSALTTSGTLPKGSITRISRMVAESSSDCIASAVFLEDAEVYRPSAETIGKNWQHELAESAADRTANAASRAVPCAGAGNGRRCQTRDEHSR